MPTSLPDTREKTSTKVILLIAVVWALTRVLAWVHSDMQLSWDVWEARKLLEYGFWDRMGAMINYHFLPGLLSFPAQFNYVDHPAGAIWIYYLLYAAFGAMGISVFTALVGLAGCLLTYRVLLRFYDANTALWGALLYTVAPVAIYYDANPDFIAMGVVFWPLSIWLATLPLLATGKKACLLGLTVFVAGQISWFTWMVYPALIFLTANDGEPFVRQLKKPFKNPIWVALTVGLALTAAVFFAQIFGYSHDLVSAFSYALKRVHGEPGVSRAVMARTILIKFSMLLSPALFLGALAGMVLAVKQWGRDRLAEAAVLGLACTMIAANVLISFYYTELNGHRYALFPATLLTASLLYQTSFRWVKPLLAALCLFGLVYSQFRSATPGSSMASASLARELRQRFDPYALVFSNLSEHQPPFPAWEPLPSWNVSLAADRHIYLNIESKKALLDRLSQFRTQPKAPPVFCLIDPAQPIDAALRAYLSEHATRSEDVVLDFPPETPNFPLQLRSLYWRLSKSRYAYAADSEITGAHHFTLQVYQLQAAWPVAKD